MTLQVTSLIAGLFLFMMVPLSLMVSLRRWQMKAKYGDANDTTLRRRIRAHGNFAEYAPTALIALGLVEASGASSPLVWSLGIAFLASRILHAIGMLYTSTPSVRAVAMTTMHAAFLIAGGWLVLGFVNKFI